VTHPAARGPLLALLSLSLLQASCGPAPDPQGVERVVVVGIDGLDWRVMRGMMAEGKLPAIERFLDGGIAGELGTMAPAYSPVIWATIATGKLPREHGITGFVTRGASGAPQVPFTSNLRRAKAIWNIAGEAGRRVAVNGWWTTWPAEPVEGAMVSDRMLYNRFNLWFGNERAGGDLPAQTHPPELFERLLPLTLPAAAIEREFFERFVDGEPPAMVRELHDPWFELLMVYARDRAYGAMLERLLEEESYDLVLHYLNGPDIASHYFWKYLFPEEWDGPIAPEAVARYGGVIERYYELVDEAIGPLLAEAGAGCVVVLMSDHGFVTGRRDDSPEISGTHYRAAPPGVLAIAGGGLPAGGTIARASVTDIAPTLLHLLGLPVAHDMPGGVLAEVAASIPAPAGDPVASYESGAAPRPREPLETVYDEAILEKLRALGYID
jgi:predicted AlkP superfamily pyrophosphatase or phosphodiesterase